ncbi:MAG: hypothetical protein FJ215_01435 [Ignavibacteria bacterium]|nr:hypothetical protein [Ignavibacteria bacterium]
MRRLIGFFPFLFLIPIVGCDSSLLSDSAREEYSETFGFTRATENRDNLFVGNTNGNIRLIGVDNLREVIVSGIKVVQDVTTERASERIGEIRVVVIESSTSLTLRAEHPQSSSTTSYRVEFDIHLPNSWRVTAESVNGSVAARNFAERVDISIVNGMIDAYDIKGDLRAATTNGAIGATVYLPEQRSCILGTTNGSITLSIPRTTSATVSASTVNGLISYNNLPISVFASTPTTLSGRLGNGSATIILSAVSGTIGLVGF